MSAEKGFKLRSDLVIEPVEENGTPYYVIKDPRTEAFLSHQTPRVFPDLAIRWQNRARGDPTPRFGRKKILVSDDVLTRFAAKFRDLGLLVNDASHGEHKPMPKRSRWAGLSLKLPLANPERLLDWLYPKTKRCFSKGFVTFVAATIVTAIMIAITNRHELVFGLGRIVNFEGLFFVFATVSLVTILHELAHALTCRHFGGRVTDMGFLLLYLLPCFYVNISDTYLFREKRHRLLVVFAGGYFELFIWAASVLAWRVVATETFISRALFVVIAVCGIRSLFNFNPLIKMDGYFLLSDYLGIANLRQGSVIGDDTVGPTGRRAGRQPPVTRALRPAHSRPQR